MSREAGTFTIAPSDVVFLFAECNACFYRKIRLGIKRPKTPFPGIFGRLASIQAEYFVGRPTRDISENLPAGQIVVQERWIRSTELVLPGHESTLVIRGRIDLGLKFEGSTFGLVDIKTAKREQSLVDKYFSQLSLYSIALERPAPGQFAMNPITHMGLLVLEPDSMYAATGGYALGFQANYMPIARDDIRIYALLDEVLSVVESPFPPEPSDSCEFCSWRQ